MSCFFQKGNRVAGTPSSIIVYTFSQAFTSLRFAFKATNPAIALAASVPLTIYALQGTTGSTKTYYQYVENAILLSPYAATQGTTTQAAPVYTSKTLSASTTLSISVVADSAMTIADYYVIKTPNMTSSAVASVTAATITTFGASEIIVFPKTAYIVIRPTAATAAAATYSASIANVYNPDTATASSQMTFSAIGTYFSRMTANKISYTNAAAVTATLSAPVVAVTSTSTYRKSTMTITLSAVYRGVVTVIIDVASQISLLNDCSEGINSQIQVLRCTTDTTNNRIIVTLEAATFAATSRNLILRVLTQNGATAGAVGGFNYYLYTTAATSPAVTTGQSYASTGVVPGITLTAQAPNAPEPTFIKYEYVPYSENRDSLVSGAVGDLIITATLANDVAVGSEIRISLDNFGVGVSTKTLGDAVSTPAAIVSTGSTFTVMTASIPAIDSLSVIATRAIASGSTVTMRFTQYAVGGDYYGLVAQTTTTQTLAITMDIYDNTGTLVGNEPSAAVSSFITRNTAPGRVPLRLKFTLATALPVTTGTVTLTLPANEFNYDTTSNLACYFRTYTNSLDYTESTATSCTASGALNTGFVITAVTSVALAQNTLQELVVETDSASNPYFNVISSANKQLLVSFASAGTTLVAGSSITLYQYQATPFISASGFSYMTKLAQDPNTLFIQLSTATTILAFPSTLIELELSSASSAIIKSGLAQGTRDIQCGLVTLTLRTSSVATLRCTLVSSSPPRVRIENYAAIASGASFYLMLYDLDNSVVAQDYLSFLDAKLIVTNLATNLQSQYQLTRMYQANTGTAGVTPTTQAFPTSSATTYNTVTVLSSTIGWNAADTCTNCRFLVRGLATDWAFLTSTDFQFLINSASQTVILDQVNNIFGNYLL